MKVLVTAGPTREYIDPVRYITNRSSGKMGYALAQKACEAGHDVTLLSGPVRLDVPVGVRCVSVETSEEMLQAVVKEVQGVDLLMMSAAVCDYRVSEFQDHKIKKQATEIDLRLVKNEDILWRVSQMDLPCFVVGFAAESQDLIENATEKMHFKSLDMMVANEILSADTGFDSDDNKGVVLFPNGEQHEIQKCAKLEFAAIVLDMVEKQVDLRPRVT